MIADAPPAPAPARGERAVVPVVPGERVMLTHHRVDDRGRVPEHAGDISIGAPRRPLGIPRPVAGVDSLGSGEFGGPVPGRVALTRPVSRPG